MNGSPARPPRTASTTSGASSASRKVWPAVQVPRPRRPPFPTSRFAASSRSAAWCLLLDLDLDLAAQRRVRLRPALRDPLADHHVIAHGRTSACCRSCLACRFAAFRARRSCTFTLLRPCALLGPWHPPPPPPHDLSTPAPQPAAAATPSPAATAAADPTANTSAGQSSRASPRSRSTWSVTRPTIAPAGSAAPRTSPPPSTPPPTPRSPRRRAPQARDPRCPAHRAPSAAPTRKSGSPPVVVQQLHPPPVQQRQTLQVNLALRLVARSCNAPPASSTAPAATRPRTCHPRTWCTPYCFNNPANSSTTASGLNGGRRSRTQSTTATPASACATPP